MMDDLKKWAWWLWMILMLVVLVYGSCGGRTTIDCMGWFVKPRLTYPEDP